MAAFDNFTIKISINGEQLNVLYYVTEQLDVVTSKEDLFSESFSAMENDTVGNLDGLGRRMCNTWNSILFSINDGITSLQSVTYSKADMENEMSTVPYTLGEFIYNQYLTLSNIAKNK